MSKHLTYAYAAQVAHTPTHMHSHTQAHREARIDIYGIADRWACLYLLQVCYLLNMLMPICRYRAQTYSGDCVCGISRDRQARRCQPCFHSILKRASLRVCVCQPGHVLDRQPDEQIAPYNELLAPEFPIILSSIFYQRVECEFSKIISANEWTRLLQNKMQLLAGTRCVGMCVCVCVYECVHVSRVEANWFQILAKLVQ